MKTLYMSDRYPCFCSALKDIGYNIIPTENINLFLTPEQRHADMQLLTIGNKRFYIKDCAEPIGKSYPDNVRLNCLYFGGKLYGKIKAIDSTVRNHCQKQGIELVDVAQGYTRCSTFVIGDNAAITADKSIEKALKNNGAEVLLISPGHIVLRGFDYGFIGGAGFFDNNTAYFFGDITAHPDYNGIKEFCNERAVKIIPLCKTQPLTDIGGAVIV